MKLIGTDISIGECRASGYPVVKAATKTLDPDRPYDLTISHPHMWPYGWPKIGVERRRLYAVDTMTSYRDMWETFERQGVGIKDYCDFKTCPLPSPEENPCFLDFVQLAGIVHSYCGLD